MVNIGKIICTFAGDYECEGPMRAPERLNLKYAIMMIVTMALMVMITQLIPAIIDMVFSPSPSVMAVIRTLVTFLSIASSHRVVHKIIVGPYAKLRTKL